MGLGQRRLGEERDVVPARPLLHRGQHLLDARRLLPGEPAGADRLFEYGDRRLDDIAPTLEAVDERIEGPARVEVGRVLRQYRPDQLGDGVEALASVHGAHGPGE